LLVAVSGGVDSMVLAVLIYSFFSIEAYDLNNLTFVHLHHGVRKESDEEMLFVERFFN
jgi:tRNA(Ile)-lysidine synthase